MITFLYIIMCLTCDRYMPIIISIIRYYHYRIVFGLMVTFVCCLFMRRWWWYQTCLSANIQPGFPGRGDSERDLWRDRKRTGSVLQVWLRGTAVRCLRRSFRWPSQDTRPSFRGGQRYGGHLVAEPVSTQRWPVPVRDVHDQLETGERTLAANFNKKYMLRNELNRFPPKWPLTIITIMAVFRQRLNILNFSKKN